MSYFKFNIRQENNSNKLSTVDLARCSRTYWAIMLWHHYLSIRKPAFPFDILTGYDWQYSTNISPISGNTTPKSNILLIVSLNLTDIFFNVCLSGQPEKRLRRNLHCILVTLKTMVEKKITPSVNGNQFWKFHIQKIFLVEYNNVECWMLYLPSANNVK